MRLISSAKLKAFWITYPETEKSLNLWIKDVQDANWLSPNDIKIKYRSASILKDRRVVFNICGNKYRLIVAIAYQQGIVYVKFIGTHFEYDKIDANTVSMYA